MADPMTSVEPTCGARSMAHAALFRRASMRPPSIGQGQLLLPRAAFLYTLTSLTGGVCQLRTSRDTLRAIQRAFREAMISLPTEEYDWFDVETRRQGGGTDSVPPDAAEADGLAQLPQFPAFSAATASRRVGATASTQSDTAYR